MHKTCTNQWISPLATAMDVLSIQFVCYFFLLISNNLLHYLDSNLVWKWWTQFFADVDVASHDMIIIDIPSKIFLEIRYIFVHFSRCELWKWELPQSGIGDPSRCTFELISLQRPIRRHVRVERIGWKLKKIFRKCAHGSKPKINTEKAQNEKLARVFYSVQRTSHVNWKHK